MTMSSRSCETGSASGFALAEHQRDAVHRLEEILARYGGAILADEPGLGKSFIAAAMARGRDDCEFIVPASLVPQWEETLRDLGVSARIVTHDRILTDPARARFIVVDEAHGFRNPRTQRYDALARRSARAQMLLVTATPICNSARDLEALLALIVADDSLRECGVPSIDAAFAARDRDALNIITGELVVRRNRTFLPAVLQFGDLSRRVIRFETFTADGEIARLIDSLRFPLIGENALLRQFLWRRLTSSEAALLESLRRQRRFYERALECLAAGRALPKQAYRRLFGREEDAQSFQTVLFWDMFVPPDVSANAAEIEEEMDRIDRLRQLAESSPCTKRERLLELCAKTKEPTLIFTGWAATAIDLHRHLHGSALATGRARTRGAAAIEAFRAGYVDVLVSTDLAAEGLNLQRAGVVIHYDVPWNPVKLDQRNGRAHRIGQKRPKVVAYYFLSHDDPVMRVVARKKRITRALSTQHPAPSTAVRTLRPRVTNPAAAAWPLCFQRRNKAGIERLLTAGNLDALL
jgi:superfamily II DNA or RNA helicase